MNDSNVYVGLATAEVPRVQAAVRSKRLKENRDDRGQTTTANTNPKHEVKVMKRAEQRRLIGLARTGQRQARIVKLANGFGYVVGIHANIGKPWRIVPVTNGATTLKGATVRFGQLLPGKTPPVRVFDESKLSEA